MAKYEVERPEDDERYLDDIQNLFIGRINNAFGTIRTEQGVFTPAWTGEVLLYPERTEEGMTMRLRRLALYDSLDDSSSDPRLGTVSLSSIINQEQRYRGSENNAHLLLQLHYDDLSRLTNEGRKEGFPGDEDAVFPLVEAIEAMLSWQIIDISNEKLWLEISLAMLGLRDHRSGTILDLSLDPVTVEFELAGTGAPRPKPTYSLPSNCPSLPLNCDAAFSTVTRTLAMRFVNLSSFSADDEDVANSGQSLEKLCLEQIESLCEIWRNKSSLDLIIEHAIVEGNQNHKGTYSSCTWANETTIQNAGYAVPEAIEIYLVDELLAANRAGGGVAHNCNKASCYIILAVEKLSVNPCLVAHEMGHAIGLLHPGSATFVGRLVGLDNSIAEPGTPNPTAQSMHNLQIFTDTTFPLNPLVLTTTSQDCFRPDI